MSLETAIAELTKAITKNNELMEASLETRAAAVQAIAKTGKSESKPAKEDKPAKAAKAESKPAKADKEDGEITLATLKNAFGNFMDVDDEDELDARKDTVTKILKKFGAKKVAELEEDDYVAAHKLLQKAIAALDSADDEDEKPAKGKKKPARDEDEDDSDDEDEEDDE